MKILKTDNMHVPLKLWNEKVIIDQKTVDQMSQICELPFVFHHAALMPDGHCGIGASVGSVIATKGAIVPALAGVDLGCGMMAVKTSLKASDLPDSLKEIRTNIESKVPVGFKVHKDNSHYTSVYLQLMWNKWNDDTGVLRNNFNNFGDTIRNQVGTLGGGNHFIELCLDEGNCMGCGPKRYFNKDKEGCLICEGKSDPNVWIMLHSGSRGIGNKIGSMFIDRAKKDMEQYFINLPNKDLAYLPINTQNYNEYVDAVGFAQEYAAFNREVMLDLIIDAIKNSKLPDFTLTEEAINCHHNYIELENHYGENVYVTRKGAIRARKGDLGIIPGSMGACSYIVRGKGNPESFNSCSHGAGRLMSRTEAQKKFTVEDHIKATQGVECRKDKDVIDETPKAYKNIDDVMESQKDLVDIVYKLKQVLCVKG